MESLHDFDAAHWDHEPRAWSADLQVGAFGARHAAPSWSSALRFMGSHHATSGAHWDHEPRAWSADLQVGAFGARHTAPSWSSALRFMESLHVIFGAHWDHEPRRVRSAGFRACGFGRLSSRPFLVHRTRKSGKPPGWKACATSRLMGSLLSF